MTTVSDSGLERIGDQIKADVAFLAVGSGQNESTTASGLGSQTGTTGEFEAIIRIKGGTEVSAGTAISEVGLFDGDPAGSGTLLVIDEFAGITVEAGHTEEFTVPIDPRRV